MRQMTEIQRGLRAEADAESAAIARWAAEDAAHAAREERLDRRVARQLAGYDDEDAGTLAYEAAVAEEAWAARVREVAGQLVVARADRQQAMWRVTSATTPLARRIALRAFQVATREVRRLAASHAALTGKEALGAA